MNGRLIRSTLIVAAGVVVSPAFAEAAAPSAPAPSASAAAAAGGSTAPAPASSEVAQLRQEVAALRQLVESLQRQVERMNQAPGGAAPVAQAPTPEAQAAPAPETPPAGAAGTSDLEKQLAAELGGGGGAGTTAAAGSAGSGAAASTGAAGGWSPSQPIQLVSGAGGKNFLNLSLTSLAAAGTSSTPNVEAIESGGHDPNQRGFTIQNVETVLDGAVDPYFKGQANMVMQLDNGGGTTVELEEAYLVSTSLPHNLQVKGGTFLTDFGRLNQQHPHAWDFVDQPLVDGRFLGGDGLRGPGARLSWLMPTPFYSELFLTAQDSQGNTAWSFRNTPGEEFLGRPLEDRPVRSGTDLLLTPRWATSFDLSDTQTILAGVSAAFGPNAAGEDTRTRIEGLDLFWKWKPVNAMAGFPFLKWQTELMNRHYETDAFMADENGDGTTDVSLRAGTYKDWGGYTQLAWGFRRGWVAGLRWDWLDAERGPDASLVGEPRRWRVSPNVTWFPTEFSKLRLQYNRDHGAPDPGDSEDSLWLQVEFNLGAHAAHKF